MKEFQTEEGRKAAGKAMCLLEHMDRTEKNLRDRLSQAGFSREAVQEALDYVKSFGYINDERYAQYYISYRLGIKSKRKIFQELQQKGVDRQIIQDAWEEVSAYEEADEKEMIRKLVRKKYEPGSELEPGELRRLYGYLERRGFRWQDIQSVLDEEGL